MYAAPLAHFQLISSSYLETDYFGKSIFIALFFLSTLSWILLLHKFWMMKKIVKIASLTKLFLEKKKDSLLSVTLTQLPQMSHKKIPNSFLKIFAAFKEKTITTLNKNLFFAKELCADAKPFLSPTDLNVIESHVMTTISSEIKRLSKNLFLLMTISTLAPFLGLLGTVWGILCTFSGLQMGGGITSSAVLGGLSTALVTTILGLVIAIPALIAYHYLGSIQKNFFSDMEDFLHTLISDVEIQYRKVEVPSYA